jgi:SLT domain-containing protein
MLCMLRFTAEHFYQIWAVVGPLAGVALGAWQAARWQRKKWILDNKASEYRGILDALNSYRFALVEYYSLYKIALIAMPAQKKYDDQITFAKAGESVTNALADRIFTYPAIEATGARKDWSAIADELRAEKSDLNKLLKMVDGLHDKLVKASRNDLKITDA